MENNNSVSVTPKRPHKFLKERQVQSDTRRSLFQRSDSDLSDISPLSRTSSELFSPQRNSPIKIVTPFRVRGVSHLSPDHGIIKPNLFYGGSKSASASLGGAEMYREIRKSISETSKVRMRLFLDDIPRNKKRPRSSGNPSESFKQEKKKIKLQPNLTSYVKKPSKNEIQRREILKRKKAFKKIKEKRLKEKNTTQGKRKYNWEIFNTSEDLHKFTWRSSVVLTPPQSTKKRRLKFNNPDDFSPSKVFEDLTDSEEQQLKDKNENLHDDLVKEIREGVLDMMKEDEEDDVTREVSVLLERLEKGDCDKENLDVNNCNNNEDTSLKLHEEINLVDSDENVENIAPKTPVKEQFFPLFNCTPKSSTSPFPKTPTSVQKKMFGKGLNQLQLDVGQNQLREIECSGCGLLYVQGNPEDMAEHDIFHFKFKELHFNGWKNERIVRYDKFNKIICVRDSDIKQWWKKATNVLNVVDSELGFPPDGPSCSQIYMYVAGKFIRGVVAVSHTTKGYKMLDLEGCEDVGLCTEEEFPVKCLISRIWVDRQLRRCNVASTLLDSVRSNFTFGCIMKTSDLAFTSPTEDGRKFIEAYTKTKEYFVHT